MPSIAEEVASRLAPYLGAINAKVRVKTVAEKKLGTSADALSVADVAPLMEGIRPALGMLLGHEAAGELIHKIEREVV
jgi:hypothetical protein